MSKGKAIGFKKAVLTLEDTSIEPFYIQQDDLQYTVFKKGNTLAIGYYKNLDHALKRISKDKILLNHNQSTLTLSDYIKQYETVINNITSQISL